MSNGWYQVAEAFIKSLNLSDLMGYAERYGIDLDNDIDEIRQEVSDIMSRRARDEIAH